MIQVAAHGPRVDCQGDRFTDGLRRVAITALEVNRHRQLSGADDSAQVVNRQGERSPLTIGETVGIGD